MKNGSLSTAIAMVLGVSAMAGYSSQASAFQSINLGTYSGASISLDTTTPYKAFSDYLTGNSSGSYNQGWVHTARFLRLTVGSAAEITSGATYDVQLKMTGRGNLNAGSPGPAAINNPSFAVWSAGANTINTAAVIGEGHGWNPSRGYGESALDINGNQTTSLTNNFFVLAGVTTGHAGWVGYVNSGPEYTLVQNLDPLGGQPQSSSGVKMQDAISHGALNTSSLTALTNPGASNTSYTNNFYRSSPGGAMVGTEYDYALMNLYGLKAGNYLIATGGSCPNNATDSGAAAACGNGNAYTFTVSQAPAAVPVPGAVWLFGSAMAGLVGVSRRKQA